MTPGQEIVLDDALRQLRLPAMGREWREPLCANMVETPA